MRKNGVVLVLAMVLVVGLAGCETPWRTGRFDSRSSGFNPGETAIHEHNVASLAVQATADVPGPLGPWAQPIVVNGSVYLGGAQGLVVYSADASAGCAGEPTTCTPRWTAPVDGRKIQGVPTVADGKVFVSATDPANLANAAIYVFDAAGGIGCGGAPKVCRPLWTAPVGGVGSVLVNDHRVFVVVTATQRIAVLDADGVIGCAGTPKVCQPMWTTTTTYNGSIHQVNAPSAAAGVVVIMDTWGTIYAYDAAGTTNCNGSPIVCAALWRAPGYPGFGSGPGNPTNLTWTALMVVGDHVIGYRSWQSDTTLVAAFDLHGAEGCAGTPKICAPVWSTLVDGAAVDAEVTAAYGSIFVITEGTVANHGSRLTAIADDGAGCTGVPMMCPIQWQHLIPAGSPTATRFAAPIVANGLLYVPTYAGFRVFNAHPLSPSRDWAASPGECTQAPGAPLTCQPIATVPGPAVERNASISDGRLYVAESVLDAYGFSPASSQLKIYGL